MPRQLSADAQQKIAALSNISTHLVELVFDTGAANETVRLTTASQRIVTSGLDGVPNDEWTAIGFASGGSPVGIGTIQETDDLRAQSVEVSLNGVDPSAIAIIQNNFFRGRTIRIWKAYMNPSTGGISSAILMWSGYQNEPWEITETNDFDSKTVTVSTRSVSRLAILARTRPVMTNVSSHSSMLGRVGINTIDNGFSTIPSIVDKEVYWGRLAPIRVARPKGTHAAGGGQ
jgi:hypothetical protein